MYLIGYLDNVWRASHNKTAPHKNLCFSFVALKRHVRLSPKNLQLVYCNLCRHYQNMSILYKFGIWILNCVKLSKYFKARRALRALKGLVKLQALVRGHNVRKRTTLTLARMQALLRVQTRVCDERRRLSISREGSLSSSSFTEKNAPVSSRILHQDKPVRFCSQFRLTVCL